MFVVLRGRSSRSDSREGCSHRKSHAQQYVRRSFCVLAALEQADRLQAEGGECRVAAAKPGDEKSAYVRMGLRVHVMLREDSDQKAPGDVDYEGANGKRHAAHFLSGAADEIPEYASSRAAEGDPQEHRGKITRDRTVRAGPGLARKMSMSLNAHGCRT